MFEAVELAELPAGAAKWADRVNVRLAAAKVSLVTYQLVAVCMMLFRALGEPDDVRGPGEAGLVGTVLADEAGLGKTVQGIVFAAMVQSELLRRGCQLYPVLIVVPTNGVLRQWVEWMRRFFDYIVILSNADRHTIGHDGVKAFIITASTLAHDFTNRSAYYLDPHTKLVQNKPWPDQSDIDAVYASQRFKTDTAREAMATSMRDLAAARQRAQHQRSVVYRRGLQFISLIDEAHTVGCELQPHKSSISLDDCKSPKICWWATIKIPSVVRCPMTATPMQNTNRSVLAVTVMANPSMPVRLPVSDAVMASVIRRSGRRVDRQLTAAGLCPPTVTFDVCDVTCDNERQLQVLDDIDKKIANAQARSSHEGQATFELFAAIQQAIQASLFFSIFDPVTGKLAMDIPALVDGRPNFTNVEQRMNRTLNAHFTNPAAAPVIIACAYVEGCERLRRVIEATNELQLWPANKQLRVRIYTGKLSIKDREQVLDLFGSGHVDVLIMTPSSGGTGLNLAAASLMIVFGCGWNAAAEHQMRQRIVRFGSPHKSVRIVRVSLAYSISSWMAKVAADKQVVAQDLLGGEDDEPVYGGDECFHTIETRTSFKMMARQLVGNIKELAANRRGAYLRRKAADENKAKPSNGAEAVGEPAAKRQRIF